MEIMDVTPQVHRALPRLYDLLVENRERVITAVNRELGSGISIREIVLKTTLAKVLPFLFAQQRVLTYELVVAGSPQDVDKRLDGALAYAREIPFYINGEGYVKE